MKLSEAIREGAKITQPCNEEIFYIGGGVVYADVIACAVIAHVGIPAVAKMSGMFEIYSAAARLYPVLGQDDSDEDPNWINYSEHITWLEHEGWYTREQIADIVEGWGY
jgi:hypothetical protein